MKRLAVTLGVLALLAGCDSLSSAPEGTVSLDSQRVLSCSHQGSTYLDSRTITANVSSRCSMNRDYPSASAFVRLQKQDLSDGGRWYGVRQSPTVDRYLPAGATSITFSNIKATGFCSETGLGSGYYRAAIFISWPADDPTPIGTTYYNSPSQRINC